MTYLILKFRSHLAISFVVVLGHFDVLVLPVSMSLIVYPQRCRLFDDSLLRLLWNRQLYPYICWGLIVHLFVDVKVVLDVPCFSGCGAPCCWWYVRCPFLVCHVLCKVPEDVRPSRCYWRWYASPSAMFLCCHLSLSLSFATVVGYHYQSHSNFLLLLAVFVVIYHPFLVSL